MKSPKISVITATLNCAAHLPSLVSSLLAQDDQDFDWVVADGGSRDETLEILARFPRVRFSSGADFGIYDALNRGVRMADCDYYLVVGADDELYPSAISSFRECMVATEPDMVAASIDMGDTTLRPMRGRPWLRGGNAFVAGHAVGTLIRRRLHDQCGYYSNRYPNCADMHFVLSVMARPNATIKAGHFTAGRFSAGGISSTDRVGALSDAFRIQLAFDTNKRLQLALFMARLVREFYFR